MFFSAGTAASTAMAVPAINGLSVSRTQRSTFGRETAAGIFPDRGEEIPADVTVHGRSDVDVVGGLFAGLVRVFMERRLGVDGFLGLRQRLESGDPESQGARFNSGPASPDFRQHGRRRSATHAATRGRERGAPFAHRLVQEQLDCLRDNGSRRQPTRRDRYCPYPSNRKDRS